MIDTYTGEATVSPVTEVPDTAKPYRILDKRTRMREILRVFSTREEAEQFRDIVALAASLNGLPPDELYRKWLEATAGIPGEAINYFAGCNLYRAARNTGSLPVTPIIVARASVLCDRIRKWKEACREVYNDYRIPQ